MIIVISPSKTQKAEVEMPSGKFQEPLFSKQARYLASVIGAWDSRKVAERFRIGGRLLDETVRAYREFGEGGGARAIDRYTGQVFSQLEKTPDRVAYLEGHLVILSALYGALRPNDVIQRYRLDMKTKVFGDRTLYDFWSEPMERYFAGQGPIVNLASDEFAKMIPVESLGIQFRDRVEGRLVNRATYSKMARGKMLDFMAQEGIAAPEGMKSFSGMGYRFDPTLSSSSTWIFVREARVK